MKLIIALVLLAATCCTSHAEEATPSKDFGVSASLEKRADISAVEHYTSSADFALTMCDTTRRLRVSAVELNRLGNQVDQEEMEASDYRKCISSHKLALAKLYGAAVKSTKKAGMRAALKEHYVTAINALEGIEPTSEERVIDYSRRKAAEKRALDQQRIRVEAEK